MKSKKILTIVTGILLLSITLYSRNKLESYKGSSFALERITMRPAGFFKALSLNHELSLADLLWLRSLQVFLGRFLNSSETHLFYGYLDIITNLDPEFKIAYILGSISLSVFCYNGELSNRILFKGFTKFKNNWQIPFLIGYNFFYELGNYIEGAKYMNIASRVPGAPNWLAFLSARLYSTGGEPENAVELLRRLYEITEDKKTRALIHNRLMAAIQEMHIQKIEKAIKEYERKFHIKPSRLEEIVKEGLLDKIPNPPTGGYYFIDKDGRVKSSKEQERFIIHLPMGVKKLKKEVTEGAWNQLQ